MPEIKRTVENPPVRLQKAVISRSESQEWSIAKKEWIMENTTMHPIDGVLVVPEQSLT